MHGQNNIKLLCGIVIETYKLMLYGEIIAVYSKIHTKHINALWAEHRISVCPSWCYIKELFNIKI